MGPAEFEQLLLQGQCTIEDKTTRTGETTHLMPLRSVRPQFKPISLPTNLAPHQCPGFSRWIGKGRPLKPNEENCQMKTINVGRSLSRETTAIGHSFFLVERQ
jgi:hypothetical protein